MLRIISVFLLLIISQISFASVSTKADTVAASSHSASNQELQDLALPHMIDLAKTYNRCTTGSFVFTSGRYTCSNQTSTYIECTPDSGICSFILMNISYGNITYPKTIYSCSAGYTLSGTNCTIQTTTDSCTSYQGQLTYLWVSKTNVPPTVCDGTCTATVTNYSNFPEADSLSYQGVYYTYTGETGSCTDVNTGWVDEATATAANVAAAQREVEAKIKAAEDACGSQGYIIDKLVTGPQSVICNSAFANLSSGALPTYNPNTPTTVTNSTSGATSSATSTDPDGTTTTTTTNTTTTTDTSSTSGAGGSGGSTTTTTNTTVKNPDGTTKSSTDTSTGTSNFPGLGADYKYSDSKRNDWGSRNFLTVISDNLTKLKGTNLYGSVTGFFTVSFSGSAAPSNFNVSYKGSNLSSSFDWAANLAPFQGYIRAIVMFVCSYVAFRRCIE